METSLNPLEQQKPNELTLESYGMTIPSTRHPDHNEDVIRHSMPKGFAMLLDGMGGEINGEKASKAARDSLTESLGKISNSDVEVVKKQLVEALNLASKAVGLEAQGGGTTAVVAKFLDGNKRVVIGSVGDSRAYLLRGGILKPITEDDGILEIQGIDLTARKQIDERLDNLSSQADLQVLSKAEKEAFEKRQILVQSLDGSNIRPHIYHIALQEGDKIVMTSDGVHDNLTRAEIRQIMISTSTDQTAAALTNRAHARSQELHFRSKPDDISSIVISVGSSKAADSAESSTEVFPPAQNLILKGDIVSVQRSNGSIDEGWKVIGYRQESGAAIVSKVLNGQLFTKDVPQDQLRALNRR